MGWAFSALALLALPALATTEPEMILMESLYS